MQNQVINSQKEVNQEQGTLINNQNQTIDGVNSRLNSVNSISAVNANKISQWQSEHNKVKQSISSVRQNVDTIQGNLSTVTNNLATLTNNVNDNTTNILSNTGNILSNTNNIDKNRLTGTAIRGQISDLTGNLSEINRNHNDMRDQINTNADNIQTNTTSIAVNYGGIVKVAKGLKKVSDAVIDNTVSISAVEGQISDAVNNLSLIGNNIVQNTLSLTSVRIDPIFGAFRFMDDQTPNLGNTVLIIGRNTDEEGIVINFCYDAFALQFDGDLRGDVRTKNFTIDHNDFQYRYAITFIPSPDGNKYNDLITMRLGVISGNTLEDYYMMALSIIDNDNEDLFIYRQYLPNTNSIPDELIPPNIFSTVNKLKLSEGGPQIISKSEVDKGDVVTYIATRINTDVICSNLIIPNRIEQRTNSNRNSIEQRRRP